MRDLVYDMNVEDARYGYYLRLAQLNEEYQQLLKNKEDRIILEASQEWYNEWKITYISGIKANLSRFELYLKSQNGKNQRWLAENKNMILDYHKYPPKSNEAIKSAPNYKIAIARLNKPLSSSLNGINLHRITLNQGKDNDNRR